MISVEKFKEEVLMLAEEIGVKPKEIHLRTMKRKLASCSSKGRLTFDKSILEEPKERRYEIILHELLHLKYPNHGKIFKLVLKAYLSKILDRSL
ncbi:M48 metallopeptidase family protein [Thermocrinis minervae]|uniref:YgjP-like metallopeptidase domain-containing protein n=1 Tax=Thermocrinis minervae TaxID=381751 RepID=A0A1M6STF2_9AQUI|nr:M48 family metallopeptidase [Thermocrinis minervae]SHK47965.1 hypothetical protein SAMN05444391_1159 [Thermocrinis minervae]